MRVGRPPGTLAPAPTAEHGPVRDGRAGLTGGPRRPIERDAGALGAGDAESVVQRERARLRVQLGDEDAPRERPAPPLITIRVPVGSDTSRLTSALSIGTVWT